LVSDDSHDAISKFSESHEFENTNDPGCEKELTNVASENDSIEAGVIEVDIFRKLLQERILHGQGPFWSILSWFSWPNASYRTAREKSMTGCCGGKEDRGAY
jgi:hypothetical protein